MRVLIVYDSQYGNTERIATAVADTLRASGDVLARRVDPKQALDLEGVDLLILGSPTQAHQATPAMQSMLANVAPKQLHGRPVACFDTRLPMPSWMSGSAAKAMAKRLSQLGVRLLAPPESFIVEKNEGPLRRDELSHAAAWARILLSKLEAPEAVASR